MDSKYVEPLKRQAAIVSAVALYALLVDIAVETYRSGSSLKWWGCGVLAITTLAGILGRRFLTVNRAYFLTLIAVAALVTGTAWMPGGLDFGICGLGLETGLFFSAVLGSYLLLGLGSLLSTKWLPSEVRLVLGLLFLYGLSAFGLNFGVEPSKFSSLFHGESFWKALPNWLQGAFVAGFVSFPVALLLIASRLPTLLRERRVVPGAVALLMMSGISISLAAISGESTKITSTPGEVAESSRPMDSVSTPSPTASQTPTSMAATPLSEKEPSTPAALLTSAPTLAADPASMVQAVTPQPTPERIWYTKAPLPGGSVKDTLQGQFGGMFGGAASPPTVAAVQQQPTDEPVSDVTTNLPPAGAANQAVIENSERADQASSQVQPAIANSLNVRMVPAQRDQAAQSKEGQYYDTDRLVTAEVLFSNGGVRSAQVRWLQVATNGETSEVGRSTVRAGSADSVTATLEAPDSGFPVGEYRVEVLPSEGASVSTTFSVIPLYDESSAASALPDGFDVAPAVVGGRVEMVTSERGDQTRASNLISRNLDYWDCNACGWTSKDMKSPQEVVFSFKNGRSPRVHAVIIDNATERASRHNDLNALPKYVEIYGSATDPASGYQKLGAARLPQKIGQFPISFAPQSVKFLKLRFISNYGDDVVRIASVGIIEDPRGGPSILDDVPLNIARFELGGIAVRGEGELGNLIDGTIETNPWSSDSNYLPQRLFFAFRNDQEARIEKILVKQPNSSDPSTWPKKVLVLTSSTSPISGFTEVGEFSLSQSPAPQEISINQSARYVQLAITENYGGSATSIGEVEIIETKQNGYQSVLSRNSINLVSASAMQQTSATNDLNPIAEVEPNNFPAQANQLTLGRYTKGAIDPLGENDYHKVTIPPGGLSAFSLSLLGRPTLRTSVEITRGNGVPVASFDPGSEAKDRYDLTFTGEPDEYFLRFTQPPASIVVVWDVSGSMAGRLDDLRQGVEGFISQVRPSEQMQLVSFSSTVKTLLSDFTSDVATLSGAAAPEFKEQGGTAIYDALGNAVRLLKARTGNRAIILMTDGSDQNSSMKYNDFWTMMEKEKIRVYTIGLGSSMREFQKKFGTTGERLLAHIAQSTYGRYFYAEGSKDLVGFYKEISEELKATTEYFVKPTLSLGNGMLRVDSIGEKIEQVSTPEFQLIMDASGSMRERKNLVDGRLKIDVAKDVMTSVIQELPDDAVVSMRVFGHRVAEGRKGDCEDSQLVFPLSRVNKPRLVEAISKIKALGSTMIGYSLRQSAKDFSSDSKAKMIILVTDGKEECGDNPAKAIQDLRAQGFDVRVNVVGFDLAEEAVKDQMREVAGMTGGRFFDAQSSKGLRESINQALAVPFDVVDSGGKVVRTGSIGQEPVSLPEGVYTIVVRTRGKPLSIPNISVIKEKSVAVELKKAGSEVSSSVRVQ